MRFSEILSRNRAYGPSLTGDKYRIAILSNTTVAQLKDILELTLREEGINAEVLLGDYDAIVADSARYADVNAALVFWEAGNLVEGFHNAAQDLAEADFASVATRVEREIDLVLRSLHNVSLVLVNRFSAMLFERNPLVEGALQRMTKRLNAALERQTRSNQILVDLDAVIAEVGLHSAVDFRQFLVSKALYSIAFFKAYAAAVKPAFMAVTGRVKKVLVLDCDNTLWGGVIGEDGEDGIDLGDDSPRGKAFREAQILVRGLKRSGVVLALCSKNNEADVDKILRDHPGMILRGNDFVAKRVNWRDKASNLRELAEELNVGLESFVFIDDSAFELGLVQKKLPQVKCVRVPENASEYPAAVRMLRRDFFTLSGSVEDQRKTSQYQQERQRKEDSVRFESTEDYLASLGLQVSVAWNANIPVGRVAQMTQKTSQFNLTTQRYTEADILRMLSDPAYAIAAFSVEDRYGDYGVTGLAIINDMCSGEASIDSFLMSCRVIGRNVEYSFFDHIVRTLLDRGISGVRAVYKATHKNGQVSRFYDTLRFELVSENNDLRQYHLDLQSYAFRKIAYIKHRDIQEVIVP